MTEIQPAMTFCLWLVNDWINPAIGWISGLLRTLTPFLKVKKSFLSCSNHSRNTYIPSQTHVTYLSEGKFSRSLLDSSAIIDTFLFSVETNEGDRDGACPVESIGVGAGAGTSAGAGVGAGAGAAAGVSTLSVGWFLRSLRSKGYSFIAVIRMLVFRTWNTREIIFILRFNYNFIIVEIMQRNRNQIAKWVVITHIL